MADWNSVLYNLRVTLEMDSKITAAMVASRRKNRPEMVRNLIEDGLEVRDLVTAIRDLLDVINADGEIWSRIPLGKRARVLGALAKLKHV